MPEYFVDDLLSDLQDLIDRYYEWGLTDEELIKEFLETADEVVKDMEEWDLS